MGKLVWIGLMLWATGAMAQSQGDSAIATYRQLLDEANNRFVQMTIQKDALAKQLGEALGREKEMQKKLDEFTKKKEEKEEKKAPLVAPSSTP